MRGGSQRTALAGVALCALLAAALHSAASRAAPPSPAGPVARTSAAQSDLASPSAAAGPTSGGFALTRWTLREDATDQGLARYWQRGSFSGRAVRVPSVVDGSAVRGSAGIENFEGSVAWYRTSFEADHAGSYALRFASVNYLAEVWVDGRALGSHVGSYLPFELPRSLSAGKHTLVVRVDWRDPLAQTHAGFHRTWFNFGGIDGAVSVRPIGAAKLLAPTLQTELSPDAPAAREATVALSVEVRNDGPARALAPAGTLVRGAQTIPLAFPAKTIAAGATVRLHTSVAVPDPALWSPTHPNLYALTLTLPETEPADTPPATDSTTTLPEAEPPATLPAAEPAASFSARVGLRELTWHGGRMFLNGQRLTLHGASIQEEAPGRGDALNGADDDRIVAELRAIGANATRSQHALNPGLLERLDAAGILVWQGIGPVDPPGDWTARTPALLRRAEGWVQTTAREAQLHPSIIAWNLANEVAGNGHPGGEASYVQAMARWLHAYDPGRLVAVDVWGDHAPRTAGALYRDVDAVSETDYSGWYEGVRDTSAQVRAMIRRRLRAMHRTFAGKVQLISEFGAEANGLNAPGSPGGYDFQSRLLRTHIEAYEVDPQLSGMLVWLLRDYALEPTFDGGSIRAELPHIHLVAGINQKGLFDYALHAKPAARVIARLFGALPAT